MEPPPPPQPAQQLPPPQVLSLLGPVPPEELGWTLGSEHLCQNRADLFAASAALPPTLALEMGNLADVRRQPWANLSNLRLEAKDASAELTRFGRAASAASESCTLVETTPRGWRAPEDLLALAQLATDCQPRLRLVLGSGCVAHLERPEQTAAELAAEFERDVKVGFLPLQPADEDKVVAAARTAPQGRAGLIGELVLGIPFGPADQKVLEAAAVAQRRTTAAVLVTVPGVGRDDGYVTHLLEELLVRLAIAPERLLLGGMGQGQGEAGLAADERDMVAVAQRGCGLVVSVSGNCEVLAVPEDPAAPGAGAPCRTDEQAAMMVGMMCAVGYTHQIVLAQSLQFRTQLAAYGGEGLSLAATFPPRLARHGVSAEQMRAMATENMGRMLAFWLPPPPPKPVAKVKWECCHCGRRRIEGDDSFTRLGYRYCAIKCLNEHRPIADQAIVADGEGSGGAGASGGGGGGDGTVWGVSVGSN